MKIFNFDEILKLEKYYRISLINKISGLKSANLIATKNSSGSSNLAIFNSVTHIGANPPLLGFIMRPLLVERHTYNNIKENGLFTINQISVTMHERAHQSSAKYPKGTSEFDECGLDEIYLDSFPIPFVRESKIKIGLSYQEEHIIKTNNTILIIGRIEKIIMPEHEITKDGDINFESLKTVGIGGLDSYYSCSRIGKYGYARVKNKKISS